LEDFADIAGIELLVIDDKTTIRDFKDRLNAMKLIIICSNMDVISKKKTKIMNIVKRCVYGSSIVSLFCINVQCSKG
jgi:hypothetical protein